MRCSDKCNLISTRLANDAARRRAFVGQYACQVVACEGAWWGWDNMRDLRTGASGMWGEFGISGERRDHPTAGKPWKSRTQDAKADAGTHAGAVRELATAPPSGWKRGCFCEWIGSSDASTATTIFRSHGFSQPWAFYAHLFPAFAIIPAPKPNGGS